MLFADISGFTEYSSHVTPEQVMDMLKKLFVEFDKLCQDLDTYKLYTIGDCYVAIGANDFGNRNAQQEAINILYLAFGMIDIIASVREAIKFDGLQMRIGIHTGDVIGGVMGTDIVRYDIYGEDVLIANKMESYGRKGHVQISQKTKDLIDTEEGKGFVFQYHQKVSIPSIKKEINGYLVEIKKDDKELNEK